MPKQKSIQPEINFSKGFITEANPINFPENFFDAGDNVEVDINGEVSRRLAIGTEDGFGYSSLFSKISTLGYKIQDYSWVNPAADNSVKFLVIRFGRILYFFDVTNGSGSANEKSFTKALTDHGIVSASVLETQEISFAANNDQLFIAGEGLEPFYIQYDPDTDTISSTEITIEVRDLEDADPNTGNEDELVSLTPAQEYDLVNRGWSSPGGTEADPKATYFTSRSHYPPKSKNPWMGLNASDAFEANLLDRTYAGNGSGALGHFILDFFNKDRDAVSGLSGVPGEIIDTRPKHVTFFAGRIWWAWQNVLFYTQTLRGDEQIGRCYQLNDPISNELSDLVDSDGGTIPINALSEVKGFTQLGNPLIVVGDNGAWAISGSDGIFKATQHSLTRLTEEGMTSSDSLLAFKGGVAYWSKNSVNVIVVDDVSQAPVVRDVSAQVIGSFYNELPDHSKTTVKGVYNKAQRELVWFYNGDATVDTSKHQYYNKILKYKLVTTAFVPQSIPTTNDYPLVASAFAVDDAVIIDGKATNLKQLVLVEDGTDVKWTFCEFNDRGFKDFEDFGFGVDPGSFIEPGHRTFGDTMTYKQAPYVMCFFRRTETAHVLSGSDYVFDFPSSCFLKGKWDWSDLDSSGRWTSNIQAYRFTRPYIVDPMDLTFNYGHDVIVTKNKLRGRGRSLRIRYESEEGKDFRLLGWSLLVERDTDI